MHQPGAAKFLSKANDWTGALMTPAAFYYTGDDDDAGDGPTDRRERSDDLDEMPEKTERRTTIVFRLLLFVRLALFPLPENRKENKKPNGPAKSSRACQNTVATHVSSDGISST